MRHAGERDGKTTQTFHQTPFINVERRDAHVGSWTSAFNRLEEWAKLRRPGAVEFAARRRKCLANNLADKAYLDGERFTAGDLMMASVLRIMPELTNAEPRLTAYVERCTARPAFRRAYDAQMGDFKQAA